MILDTGACLSADRFYRYSLWRRLTLGTKKTMLVIGFNPSSADEWEDDPTIRRCKSFALREGCGRLEMINLYAYRSTNPNAIPGLGPTAIGPDNDETIRESIKRCFLVVAAWGALPAKQERIEVVIEAAKRAKRVLYCFGTTKSGAPRHPLYIRNDTPLERWSI